VTASDHQGLLKCWMSSVAIQESVHFGILDGKTVFFFVEILYNFFDEMSRLDTGGQPRSGSNTDDGNTFGSRFSAMVRCLIAIVLLCILLKSLPSVKCTFASSGARSFRIMSSSSAAYSSSASRSIAIHTQK